MTSGIYKLVFNSDEDTLFYIGRSIKIEQRYAQHLYSLKNGFSAKKLQRAYNNFGIPKLEILEVSDTDLEELEEKYINKYNAIVVGLNSIGASYGKRSGAAGELNGRSKYDNDMIISAFFMLISKHPYYNYPSIEKETGVPKATITDIANFTGHTWLKEVYPEEYKLLAKTGVSRNTSRYYMAISPEGVKYTGTHLSSFCIEHKLDTGNMSRLLRGQRNSYNNWTALKNEN